MAELKCRLYEPFPHAIKLFCWKNPFIEAGRLAIGTYFLTWSFFTKLTKQNSDHIDTSGCTLTECSLRWRLK